MVDQDALDRLQRAHLLSQPGISIKPINIPLPSAHRSGLATLAPLGSSLGGGVQQPIDRGLDGRDHHLGGVDEPREIPLEGLHVRVANVDMLAGVLVHDVGGVLDIAEGGEVVLRAVEEFLGAIDPFILVGAGADVSHHGGAVRVNALAVGEGYRRGGVDVGAVLSGAGTVEDLVVLVNHTSSLGPIPHLVCPVDVGLVAGNASQTCRELEKSAVADRVLVIKTVGVRFKDLPPKATVAG